MKKVSSDMTSNRPGNFPKEPGKARGRPPGSPLKQAIARIVSEAGVCCSPKMIRSMLVRQRFAFVSQATVNQTLAAMDKEAGSGVIRVWHGRYAPPDWRPEPAEAWLAREIGGAEGGLVNTKTLRHRFGKAYGPLALDSDLDDALERLRRRGVVCTLGEDVHTLTAGVRAFLT